MSAAPGACGGCRSGGRKTIARIKRPATFSEKQAMKRSSSTLFRPDRDDFMPVIFGGFMVILGFPAFFGVYFFPDQGAGKIAFFFLLLLGLMSLVGVALIVAGLRRCAEPGSLIYDVVHLRLLPRWRRRRSRV
jgi:hypothetical protein